MQTTRFSSARYTNARHDPAIMLETPQQIIQARTHRLRPFLERVICQFDEALGPSLFTMQVMHDTNKRNEVSTTIPEQQLAVRPIGTGPIGYGAVDK